MKPGLLMLPSAVSDSRVHNILPNKIETDFQFSRASAATRVNHQGLIENVGYFSDELIQNGDFSELGSELVINGDFDNGLNGWSSHNGSILELQDGKAKVTTVGNQGWIKRTDLSIQSGKTYFCKAEITNALDPKIFINATQNQLSPMPLISGNLYGGYITTTGNNATFYIRGNNTDGEVSFIDNVSVKQVDPDDDWVINGEWEYVDNGVSITNATGTYNDSALYQFITLDSSKQYKATIDISSISGGLQVYTGSFSPGFTINTTGVKSFILDLTSVGGRVNLLPANGSDVVIKSFSLVEVIGDKPRLDYDPTNPTCPHLLLEPQSTNLIKFSNDYTQSEWNKISGATVDANVAISPDGTLNASRLNFDTVSGSRMEDQIPGAASGDYSFAVYLKADEPKTVGIRTGFAGTPTVNINVTTEWQRFSITQNNPTNPANGYAQIRSIDASGGSVYVWGAQIEQLSYSTSLIPTAGATETRVQETCTSAGNLNTFNNSEGTIYAEIAGLVSGATVRSIGISDGTSANRVNISLWRNGSNDQLLNFVGVGGVSQCNFFGAVNSILEFNKVAFNYKQNDFKMYINGVLVGTDTSGNTFPADTLIKFNFDRGEGNSKFFGKTKALATYNRALTDTELYTITSTQYSAYSGMVAALGNYTIPC